MGQVNVNPPSGPGGPVIVHDDGGFGAGMIIGIILLILIVLVLIFYAGPIATALDPLAVRTMAEVGIDISGQRSKSVDDVGEGWDVVVTVCDANCPVPPRSGMKLRWHFADPALADGTEEERLAAFRTVRDGIQKRVRSLAARLS